MLLWLLNLDFAGGFLPVTPTIFIPVQFEAAIVVLGQQDCPVRFEAAVDVLGQRDCPVRYDDAIIVSDDTDKGL